MQRRTSKLLVRLFPLGLRFDSKNMSPLPGWLAGSQNVALNMSTNDLAVQLHYALFNCSQGFVLKPAEMNAHASTPMARATRAKAPPGGGSDGGPDEDAYWPPPCLLYTSPSPRDAHES
eukprot:784224-Prymnesium_polylepis.1